MGCEKTYLLDLDGTMYCGDTLIEGARVFVEDVYKRQGYRTDPGWTIWHWFPKDATVQYLS